MLHIGMIGPIRDDNLKSNHDSRLSVCKSYSLVTPVYEETVTLHIGSIRNIDPMLSNYDTIIMSLQIKYASSQKSSRRYPACKVSYENGYASLL